MRCDALLAVASAAEFLSTIGTCRAGVSSNGRGDYGAGPSLDVKCKRSQAATKDDAMVDTGGADQRRNVVWSFQLGRERKAPHQGRRPCRIGCASPRHLDCALVSRPNEVVSKKELLARVWPDVTVEEGSLRFHIASLRKALGDGKDGARYITTLAGRGYCFVAPISRSSDRRPGLAAVAASFSHANLPSRLMRMVGRDDDVLRLSTQLIATRFVTIVGTGGVGKTTVAVAVGTSPDRGLRRRRALRRSWNAERSRSGGHGGGLHAGAIGSV